MKKKNYIMKKLTLLLLLILLLAGCVQLPIQQEAKDVKVELRLDSTNLQAGSKLGISLLIENYADFDILNSTARIYGPSWVNEEEKSVPSYMLPLRKGSAYEFNWIVKVPSEEKYKKYYQIFSDVKYNAYNFKRVVITGVSYEYYRRVGSVQSFSFSDSLGGPLEIEIVPYKSELIAHDEEKLPFKFAVIIRNKGSGKPCSDYASLNCSEDTFNEVLFGFRNETSQIEIECEKKGEIALIKSKDYAHFDCIGNLTQVKDVSTQIVEFWINYTYIETLTSPQISVEPVGFH